MNIQSAWAQCLTFINTQIKPAAGPVVYPAIEPSGRLVTISREAGSDAHLIAQRLAERLQSIIPGEDRVWTVFDRNLVDKVIEDHHLPGRLARFMPEDRTQELTDLMDELFGLHPRSESLVRQTSETILRLADLGSVILIGRGANLLTRRHKGALHVRLVGSPERRSARVQEARQVSSREAFDYIRAEDLGRARYLKKYFNAEIGDPLLYHLVLNTDWISTDGAVDLIAKALLGVGKSEATTVSGLARH